MSDLTATSDSWTMLSMAHTDAKLTDYMTVEQVATASGRSARSVARLLANGTIAAAKVELFNRTVIHRSELVKIPKRMARSAKRRRRG